jgi:hypothetical protein
MNEFKAEAFVLTSEQAKLIDSKQELVDKLHQLESKFACVVTTNAAASELLSTAVKRGQNLEKTIETLQRELFISLDRRASLSNFNFKKDKRNNCEKNDDIIMDLGNLTYSQLLKLKDDNNLEKKARDPSLLDCLVCNSHFSHNVALNKHIDSHFKNLIAYKRKYKADFYKAISIL